MNGRAGKRKLASSTRRWSQMQNVNTLVSRRVRFGTAAISGFLAFVAGAVIAVSAPAMVATLSASHSSSVTVSAPAAGAEQIAHNRSEAGLGGSNSGAGEQIAHNRSEKNLSSGANPGPCRGPALASPTLHPV